MYESFNTTFTQEQTSITNIKNTQISEEITQKEKNKHIRDELELIKEKIGKDFDCSKYKYYNKFVKGYFSEYIDENNFHISLINELLMRLQKNGRLSNMKSIQNFKENIIKKNFNPEIKKQKNVKEKRNYHDLKNDRVYQIGKILSSLSLFLYNKLEHFKENLIDKKFNINLFFGESQNELLDVYEFLYRILEIDSYENQEKDKLINIEKELKQFEKDKLFLKQTHDFFGNIKNSKNSKFDNISDFKIKNLENINSLKRKTPFFPSNLNEISSISKNIFENNEDKNIILSNLNDNKNYDLKIKALGSSSIIENINNNVMPQSNINSSFGKSEQDMVPYDDLIYFFNNFLKNLENNKCDQNLDFLTKNNLPVKEYEKMEKMIKINSKLLIKLKKKNLFLAYENKNYLDFILKILDFFISEENPNIDIKRIFQKLKDKLDIEKRLNLNNKTINKIEDLLKDTKNLGDLKKIITPFDFNAKNLWKSLKSRNKENKNISQKTNHMKKRVFSFEENNLSKKVDMDLWKVIFVQTSTIEDKLLKK